MEGTIEAAVTTSSHNIMIESGAAIFWVAGVFFCAAAVVGASAVDEDCCRYNEDDLFGGCPLMSTCQTRGRRRHGLVL